MGPSRERARASATQEITVLLVEVPCVRWSTRETRGSPPLAPPPRVCGEVYLTLPYLSTRETRVERAGRERRVASSKTLREQTPNMELHRLQSRSDSEIRLGDWQTFQNRGALATSPSAGVRGRVGPEIFWRICALKTHFPSKKCALTSPQKSCWKAPFAIGIYCSILPVGSPPLAHAPRPPLYPPPPAPRPATWYCYSCAASACGATRQRS